MRTIDGIEVTCGRHEWLQDPEPCEACGYRGAAAEGVTGPVEVVTLERTYVSQETWRASEIDSGGSLVRTDTIHADGRVEWSVKGTADGEYVNKSGVRKIDKIPNQETWERIHEARLRMGWVLA